MSRSVTFSIAPPGKLTGRDFTALINHTAHRARKAIIVDAVEYDRADCQHALMTFASCFPVHRERNTMLRLSVYSANALDGMFADMSALTRLTRWWAHRSTASQQRSRNKYTEYVQRETPISPVASQNRIQAYPRGRTRPVTHITCQSAAGERILEKVPGLFSGPGK